MIHSFSLWPAAATGKRTEDRLMDGQTAGQMHGRIERLMNGRMDEFFLNCILIPVLSAVTSKKYTPTVFEKNCSIPLTQQSSVRGNQLSLCGWFIMTQGLGGLLSTAEPPVNPRRPCPSPVSPWPASKTLRVRQEADMSSPSRYFLRLWRTVNRLHIGLGKQGKVVRVEWREELRKRMVQGQKKSGGGGVKRWEWSGE